VTPRGPARVLHLLSGGTVGGCEQHVLSLLSRLDRDRYEPWVAFFEAAPDQAAPMTPAFRAAGVRTVDLGGRRRTDLGAVSRLGRLLRRARFRFVHAHSFRAELAALLWARLIRPAPMVVRTVHNTDDFYTRPPYATLARVSTARLDRVIVISDAVGRHLRDNAGLPPERMTRIYYGIDLPRWESATNGARGLDETGRPPTIAVIARLAPQKGHRVLFDALPRIVQQVPDVQVRLIGHEELSTIAELRAYAESRGVAERIRFEGFQSNIAAVLSDADVKVLPSLWEGFGLVLLEAMAVGKPVVASAVDAVPEVVVDGETGLLVPPGQAEPLASAVVRVLTDRDFADRLGRAGRERVRERFALDQMVSETDAVYRELCA
jgi:glycosyltransferase involved in cell wall biosynthesis